MILTVDNNAIHVLMSNLSVGLKKYNPSISKCKVFFFFFFLIRYKRFVYSNSHTCMYKINGFSFGYLKKSIKCPTVEETRML